MEKNTLKSFVTSGLLVFLALLGVVEAKAGLVLANGVSTYVSLVNTNVTLSNRCELRLTAATAPLSGSVVNLDSADSALVLTGVKPSLALSYLPQVRISGTVAASGGNCRVTQYGGGGTIILPQSPALQPMQVFGGPQFTGDTATLRQYVYYRGPALGGFDSQIRSFKLTRGFMATVAEKTDGTGASRNYVAQDGDLEVSVLPPDLENSVRFVFVTPWRWSSKKGIAGNIESPLNVQWKYNWNISEDSTRDLEYVPIRQNRYWPDLISQNWQARAANHLLGYNEPDRPDQANITVPDAISSWGDLLAAGLRVGAPAVSDGGRDGWLYPFMAQADFAGLRVDFVPVHYYWCANPADPGGAASQMYGFLKATYDAVKRPLWITEWNNGANWTSCADPTFAQQQACVAAMIDMLEAAPFVERYALYNWVEDVRRAEWDNGSLTDAGIAYRNKVSGLAYRQAFPDNGTRGAAYLPMDGGTLDRSGYGNNAVASGSPAYVAGKKGQAVSFDGSNTVLTLPQNIAHGASFSFAAWIYWKGGGNWQRIFDFGNSTTEYLFLTPSSGSGTLRFGITQGGGEQIVETSALPLNQWRHVAITLSGNTARLYVNGVLAASNTAMSISPSQFNPRVNFIGKSQFSADPLLNALVDDVVITDSVLTAGQIAALQTDAPPQFPSATLAAISATQGRSFNASVAGSATDPNGGAISYEKSTGAPWLNVSASGAITGTPPADAVGTNYVTIRATDPPGLSAFAVLPVIVSSSLTGGPALLAHYTFDGNGNDSSGNAFNATSSGSPTYVTGKFGSAADLDGTNRFFVLPGSLLSGVSDFTFSAWINWDGGAAWQRLFDFGNGTSQYLYLTPSSGSGTLRFAIKNGGDEQAMESSALPLKQWHHVAVTLQGKTGRLYVDGVQVSMQTNFAASPAAFNPRSNFLGKSQYPDPLFNGRIDEVFLFNYALSGAEISRLLNNLPPPVLSSLSVSISGGSLQLFWPSAALGARLESTTGNPAGTVNWITVPDSASKTAISLPVDGSNAHAFFRLAYP